MFDSYRVVAVTPAGRQRYLEILLPYVLQNRPLIDEYQLWVNTGNESDVEYLRELSKSHPNFVTLKELDPHVRAAFATCLKEFGMEKSMAAQCGLIGSFFKYCTDDNTIYVRLDDDICYLEPTALETIVRFRLANPRYFLIVANTINNPCCSYIHQRFGQLSTEAGIITSNPLCEVGWGSGTMAEAIHKSFLSRLRESRTQDLKFDRWIIDGYTRIAINCIAWFGRDFAAHCSEFAPIGEEVFLTVTMPERLRRPNCICGEAIAVHFAYYHQRNHLERNTTLLAEYRSIAPVKTIVRSA